MQERTAGFWTGFAILILAVGFTVGCNDAAGTAIPGGQPVASGRTGDPQVPPGLPGALLPPPSPAVSEIVSISPDITYGSRDMLVAIETIELGQDFRTDPPLARSLTALSASSPTSVLK